VSQPTFDNQHDATQPTSAAPTPVASPTIHAPRISRRSALRTWIAGAAPLMLLAACAGPSTLVGSVSTGTSAASGANAAPAQALTASGQGTAARQSLPSCVITPQQTEGPYFVDERMNRSDIRTNTLDGAVSEGVPLTLTLHVSQVSGSACAPLAGTFVDVWHCDAQGIYSDVKDNNWGSSQGSNFLRGYQVTDENGLVQFSTVFPGWYRGRAVHIHFKVRTSLDDRNAREMTSQLYFDDAQIDQIHALPPYASKGQRDLRNNQDGIYRSGGDKLTVPLTQDGEGYAGTFNLGVQLT
jgi:protocatechuate 3,4-dioxygenase beta subunit